MYSLLTLIPFYGGDFKGHSDPKNRIQYLKATVESVRSISNRTIVGVQNDVDFGILSSLNLNVQIVNVQTDNPLFLPACLCKSVQHEINKEEFIYYTEADQILFAPELGKIMAALANKNIYLAPHRLSKVPEHLVNLDFIIGSDMRKASLTKIDGVVFAIENKSDRFRRDINEKLYVNQDMIDAYGGAFLCHHTFFDEISFSQNPILPTEYTAGFDLFNKSGALCLKTRDVLDFYVNHLSGIEFYNNHLVLEPTSDSGAYHLSVKK